MVDEQKDVSQQDSNVGFAFAIKPQKDANGKIVGYQVQSQGFGLPDEIVITIVRNWLRAVEDNYHKKFTGKQNFTVYGDGKK